MDIDPAALQNREAGAALNRDVQHVWNPQAVTELGTEEDQRPAREGPALPLVSIPAMDDGDHLNHDTLINDQVEHSILAAPC